NTQACDAEPKRGERDDLHCFCDFHLELTFLVRLLLKLRIEPLLRIVIPTSARRLDNQSWDFV
ncbi:MAG TPA: hypothetical protein VKD89_07840, partial [Candidatus Udaeobacter sp.]|nr:hypothetical protein [Candidatus Udaeobacter sp.]